MLNYARLATGWRSSRFYWDSWRKLLQPEDQDSYLAATVPDRKGYRPADIHRWCEQRRGPVPPGLIEPVDEVPVSRTAGGDEDGGPERSAA
ncbi:hypothetical protein ACWDUL_30400 [Nocardia niigatensis]|uniref:hypothetical protein n=1 Tax=Nocardia niigatensis TaxID=209249 RepID=UPI0002D66F47|nr:hypothetical protein [Nocardia niigatensis]